MLVPDTIVTELPTNSINAPLEVLKPSKAKVLVVDDEEDIIEVISYNLEKEGYQVSRALSGEEAIEKIAAEKPDLVVLDLMLPGIDGLDVCKVLKQNPELSSIPIVMLSARGDEADIVTGLELGASDYITKPFSQRILSARLKSVLKRGVLNSVPSDQTYEFQGIVIHPGRHEVRIDGEVIELTASEFKLLDLLMRKPGWVFTRMQIVDAVRGEDCAVTARSVDVQVVGLRRKLAHKADLVETVRGVGYRVKEEIGSLSLYLAG